MSSKRQSAVRTLGLVIAFASSAATLATPRRTSAEPPIRVPDVPVLDQDGKKLHFYRDLVRDKVVVIAYMFTTCTGYCPPQGRVFSKLQKALGPRMNKEVHLVSISMDPATDTPAKLDAWGRNLGRKRGWTLVTGETEKIDEISRSLLGGVARAGEHSPIAFVADLDRGVFIRVDGFDVDELLENVEELVRRRHAS